jgi:hypothetical protein
MLFSFLHFLFIDNAFIVLSILSGPQVWGWGIVDHPPPHPPLPAYSLSFRSALLILVIRLGPVGELT